MLEHILVSGPSITKKDIDYVTDAVSRAWYEKANIFHERFERAFAEYVGRRYAIALPSCTSAIHLALASLGIGPGDQVIVPEITWIATAAPISYVGATPVFADIDEKSWCLSTSSIKKNITAKTKAIIPVDLYGNMPEMDEILTVASNHNIAVIEDAAEAVGSEYRSKKAGAFGDASVFSFHGSKTMTTGEGGMLVTDREDLYKRCLYLRDHGRAVGDKLFWNETIAYKYKMSSMQAALGLAQLERIDELVSIKRQIFDWYKEELDENPNLILNYEAQHIKNSYWMVTVLINPRFGIFKEVVISQMAQANIDCRPFFYPLSSLPAYNRFIFKNEAESGNSNAYQISPYGINLPSGLKITRDQVHKVCKTLINILSEKERKK